VAIASSEILSAPTPLVPVEDAAFADVPEFVPDSVAYVPAGGDNSDAWGWATEAEFDAAETALVNQATAITALQVQVVALTEQNLALVAALRDVKKLISET
jgi:hypothetical protein